MATIAGYDNTRQQIMETLADRVVGTEIQPEAHQQFALALLEYIRSVELISASTLIGQCTPATQPVQPDDANVAYVGAAPQASTTIWTNFHGIDGKSLTTTTTSTSVALCVFTWNKEYWTMTTMTMDITDLLQETNQRMQNLEETLNQEIQNRKNADNVLQNNINQEIQARTESDKTLDNKIAANKPTTKVYDETLKLYQDVINDNGIIICRDIIDTSNVMTIEEGYPYIEKDANGYLVNIIRRSGNNISRTPVISGKFYSVNKTLYEIHHWYLIKVSYPSRVFDGGRADSQYGGTRNVDAGTAAE